MPEKEARMGIGSSNGIKTVGLVQVNVVGVQAAQRFFTGFADPFRGGVRSRHLARSFVKGGVKFRGDDELRPATSGGAA